MKIRFSHHARLQIRQRNIARSDVISALEFPDNIRHQPPHRFRALKRTRIGSKLYLLVVIAERGADEIVIVTVFRTSKAEKYL